jgi:hypothetical protein
LIQIKDNRIQIASTVERHLLEKTEHMYQHLEGTTPKEHEYYENRGDTSRHTKYMQTVVAFLYRKRYFFTKNFLCSVDVLSW